MAKAGSENPLGLGLIILGAIVMAIAAFLPFAEPIGPFAVVRSNTLIQHDGWPLIVMAIAIAASGYRVSKRNAKEWMVPTILCLIAAVGTVFIANYKDLRTLYPVGPNGVPDTSQPGMVATLGIATYVAGAGVVAALIGSLILRQSTLSRAADDVETHDYSDADDPDALPSARPLPPQPWPTGKTGKVRCHHCQHVQAVPRIQRTFVCEQCGTKLRRRTTPV
jgi:hypothetical protein